MTYLGDFLLACFNDKVSSTYPVPNADNKDAKRGPEFRGFFFGDGPLARMYMPYLMCGYAAAGVLLLIGCWLSARSIPGLRGVRLLGWALVFGLICVVLMAVRPWAPAWLTILVSNEALFVCSLLIYCATAEMLTAPRPSLFWGVGLLTAALAGNAWFTYVHPSLTPRMFIGSGVCGLCALATAALLFQNRDLSGEEMVGAPTLQAPILGLAWLQVFAAVLHVVRCVLTFLYPPVQIVHMDLIQAGFTYLNMLTGVGSGCGLIWLALCMHRRDLHAIAQTDPLTGVLNRRAFEEILFRELRRSNHSRQPVAVLLLDIDRFKRVNDSFGHQAGDEVIRRVSAVLQSNLRPADALARYGGEEFVLLLRNASLAQAEEVAERLRTEIAGLTGLPGVSAITVSIGVAAYHSGDAANELLRQCDEALYRSKRGGRNLVTVHRSFPAHGDTAQQPA